MDVKNIFSSLALSLTKLYEPSSLDLLNFDAGSETGQDADSKADSEVAADAEAVLRPKLLWVPLSALTDGRLLFRGLSLNSP